MFDLPYELKINISCYMEPYSLLNTCLICKLPLLNRNDDKGWEFVSKFHLQEFHLIKNFNHYNNIFYLRKNGLFNVVETNLHEYIYRSSWARDWLSLNDPFIEYCIEDIMKKKIVIIQLRNYEKFFKKLYTYNQERHDLGIGYAYLIDTVMGKYDNTKFSMYQYARINGKENQLKDYYNI